MSTGRRLRRELALEHLEKGDRKAYEHWLLRAAGQQDLLALQRLAEEKPEARPWGRGYGTEVGLWRSLAKLGDAEALGRVEGAWGAGAMAAGAALGYAKGEGVKKSGKKAKALHPGGGEDVSNGYTTYIYYRCRTGGRTSVTVCYSQVMSM